SLNCAGIISKTCSGKRGSESSMINGLTSPAWASAGAAASASSAGAAVALASVSAGAAGGADAAPQAEVSIATISSNAKNLARTCIKVLLWCEVTRFDEKWGATGNGQCVLSTRIPRPRPQIEPELAVNLYYDCNENC